MKKNSAFLLLLLIGLVGNTRGQTNLTCDTTLWQHVYHKERLEVKNPCLTVSGRVMKIIKEKDGDYHIRLMLTEEDDTLLNEKNYSLQDTCLVVEIVCSCEVTQNDANEACEGFVNSVMVPKKGYVVRVTGSYVLDEEHGWMEIHPATKIKYVFD